MKQIIKPVGIGGAKLEIFKNLNGDVLISINDQTIQMNPHQTHDMAHALLQLVGMEIITPRGRAEDLGGDPMKTRIKIV